MAPLWPGSCSSAAVDSGAEAAATSQQPTGMGGAGELPQGTGPNDETVVGGGGIGIGSAPTAGEAGFTGNLN